MVLIGLAGTGVVMMEVIVMYIAEDYEEELEKKIVEYEEAIRTFSKKVVYVTDD